MDDGPIGRERNLPLKQTGELIHVVEQLRRVAVPMGIVNEARGTLTGVVTSTDLLRTILGEKP
jgi:CBS domain containing-hemolysin-like protein